MRWTCYCATIALFLCATTQAQQVIELGSTRDGQRGASASVEREYFSPIWNTPVVTNVTKPSLIAFIPETAASGAAVIICPGGGFYALSIDKEGTAAAKWLASRGVAAFVLKYRLVPSGDDGVKEVMEKLADLAKFDAAIAGAVPLAVADVLAAMDHLRENASRYRISADRIGLLGFSAGGTVAVSAMLEFPSVSRPAFAGVIYPYMRVLKQAPVPADAPPLFIAVATNDFFGLAKDSAELYLRWTGSKRSAELHAYAEGGHGFGMDKQNLPADGWIEHFLGWLQAQGFLRHGE